MMMMMMIMLIKDGLRGCRSVIQINGLILGMFVNVLFPSLDKTFVKVKFFL